MSTSTKELRKMHEKLTDFYPRAYLNNWAAGVREEWAEFLHRVFTAVVPQELDGKTADTDYTNHTVEDSQVELRTTEDGCSERVVASPGPSPVVIDIGAGPSICNIISASLWSNNIFLADLLEGNRRELDKFWRNDEEVWNWEPYFRFQGVLELCPAISAIEERTRSSISGVVTCDLSQDASSLTSPASWRMSSSARSSLTWWPPTPPCWSRS